MYNFNAFAVSDLDPVCWFSPCRVVQNRLQKRWAQVQAMPTVERFWRLLKIVWPSGRSHWRSRSHSCWAMYCAKLVDSRKHVWIKHLLWQKSYGQNLLLHVSYDDSHADQNTMIFSTRSLQRLQCATYCLWVSSLVKCSLFVLIIAYQGQCSMFHICRRIYV